MQMRGVWHWLPLFLTAVFHPSGTICSVLQWVLWERGRNQGAILQKFWGWAHMGVGCYLPLMWVFCHCLQAGIESYAETVSWLWYMGGLRYKCVTDCGKIPIRRSVFKVGAGFSLCSSAFITPFPPSVMVRLPCLSYFHLWQHKRCPSHGLKSELSVPLTACGCHVPAFQFYIVGWTCPSVMT